MERQRAGARPSGVVAFLLTDVEGSTRLWQERPEEMRTLIERHDQLLHEGIHGNRGRVLTERGEGDSFFAVFARASDAVAAARDVQLALHAEPWPDGAAIRVRMAINTGEAGGDYRGLAANRSGRLRGLAHGGQIVISQSTHALIRDHVPAGVTLVDLGVRRIRDVASPEHVYEARVDALPVPPPPPRRFPVRIAAAPAAVLALAAIATLVITHLGPASKAPNPLALRTASPAAMPLAYTLSTVAGSGAAGSAPAALATDAELDHPSGVAVTPDGTVYIADTGNDRVVKLENGTLETVVGGASATTFAVGGQIGSEVKIKRPTGLTADQQGNLYIADTGDQRVLKMAPDGTVTLVAGSGSLGRASVGTGAADAALSSPTSAVLGTIVAMADTEGRPTVGVKIIEVGNGRISMIYYGSFSPWHECAFQGVPGIVANYANWYYTCGNQVFLETGATYDLRDTVIGGSTTAGYSGDNGPSSSALLNRPQGLALNPDASRLFIADSGNNVIRMIDFDTGMITTVAGSGGELSDPLAVAVAPDGKVYVADTGNNRIRVLTPSR